MRRFAATRQVRNRLLWLWSSVILAMAIFLSVGREPPTGGRLLRSQILLESSANLVAVLFLGAIGFAMIWLVHRQTEQVFARIFARFDSWSAELTKRRVDQMLPRLSDAATTSSDNAMATVDIVENLSAAIHLLEFRYESLLQERSRTADALQGMQEGFVALDRELRLLLINAAGRQLLDMPGHVRTGKPLVELIRQPQILDLVRQAYDSGRNFESVQQVGGGHGRLLRLRVSPLNEPRLAKDGHLGHGVLLLVSDVTRLTKLESMRRDFTTNVSHELKTPLAAIQAYAETLLLGAIDDPDANRHFVEGIAKQAERLSALIHDLLQLAKLDAEPDKLALDAIALDEILAEVVTEQNPVAISKNVHLTCEPLTSDDLVHGNREALRVVVSNLISNAIRYNREGGQVFISCFVASDWTTLRIRDTGVGIPQAEHDRIFERFYRVDKARSIDVGGTGLGLAIVKHLVQQMGGEIRLDSQPGVGTQFDIRLRRLN